jgi:hypothetical protein
MSVGCVRINFGSVPRMPNPQEAQDDIQMYICTFICMYGACHEKKHFKKEETRCIKWTESLESILLRSLNQDCQKGYFENKNTNVGIFWRALECQFLVCFTV